MKAAIERQLINGIAVAVVSVLAIVVLSIWQYRRIQDTGSMIKHTNEVLSQTEEVSETAMQYEVDVKNFLLTGDPHFLAAADDSAGRLPSKITELKMLTADNAGQQRRIDSLADYIGRRRVLLEGAKLLRAGGGSGDFGDSRGSGDSGRAALLAGGQEARDYSLRIRSLMAGIEAEERRLLDLRRHAGEVKALELQWALWSLTAAVIILAVAIFRKIRLDLSREKIARERLTTNLHGSEDKYKTLFYKSPLPKWIYDEETLHFLEVNDAAVRMYGYTQDEFQRLTLADIRPADSVTTLMDDITIVRMDPMTYQDSYRRHVRKDGEVIDVQVTAHPIEVEGRKARMVAIIDITERKRYEGQLQRLNADLAKRAAELTASNAELERFAYIASHDLQEPLRMVSSFLQLLQKKYSGQLDAKADQYIHYAVDGAERMKALIMDLLEYSRVGTGKEGFARVDTAAVMAELGDVFREKIVAARAQVEIGPLPIVWGDKVQLAQLFQNLLSNALKYAGEEPPVIRLSAKEEPGCWQFAVADNGIGIDPLFFEKIFIIFQRLHNKNDYSGTGIGLAICKKIVERHGGKIWVESERQQGSTFYFTIIKKI